MLSSSPLFRQNQELELPSGEPSLGSPLTLSHRGDGIDVTSGVSLGLAWEMPMRPRQVAHLLSDLSDLRIHCLLMGSHGIEPGGQ